jgi:hypothetical protein
MRRATNRTSRRLTLVSVIVLLLATIAGSQAAVARSAVPTFSRLWVSRLEPPVPNPRAGSLLDFDDEG